MSNQPPFEQFGNYLLLERLGAGGMAEIFLARPISAMANGRLLIIKRILTHVADDANFKRMFRGEIQVCMGLTHPNIVQIYDFGENRGRPFIAMELIEGKHFRQVLNEYIKRGAAHVPFEVAVSLTAQTAAGLHYAHRFKSKSNGEHLGIIHRDISPQNLLVSYEGNVKIIDFGIAKASLESSDKTQTGIIKGKVSYLAPEQVLGQEVDARSDIFATGLVLWEMITGRKLFMYEGPHSEIQVLKMIQTCEQHVIPPSQVNPNVPPELDAIVMKSLAKDPKDRYQDGLEFQKALRGFLSAYRPGLGYADIGYALSELFAEQRESETRHCRELNEKAQEWLNESDSTKAIVVPPPFDPRRILARAVSAPPAPTGARAPALRGPVAPIAQSVVRTGLFTIQPNQTRTTHQAPAPFYKRGFPMATVVLMFLAVLLDRKYFLFDWVFSSPDLAREARAGAPPARRWAVQMPPDSRADTNDGAPARKPARGAHRSGGHKK